MEWISKPKVKASSDGADGRLAVRMRFKVARVFLTPIQRLINIGYATHKRGKTALGRAMSYTLKSCMEGEYPHIRINPALVQLAGNRKIANLFEPDADRQGELITVTWHNVRENKFNCFRDDEVIVCAYHIGLGIAGINDVIARRQDKQLHLQLPVQLKDEKVHVYLLVQSRDKKDFSNTLYLGEM